MKLSYPSGATPLDPNEIAGLLPTSITTQGELNEFEQANIAEAESWALHRKRKDVLTDKFIRELHRRMFNQVWKWAGKYRTTDKNIGGPWARVPVKMREFCDDARFWIAHSIYPWTELGAQFHHRLVSIHAFPNGNGRHARMLTDALLMNHDQELFTWGRQNLVRAGETRERYIAALRAADRRNLKSLIEFVRS